MTEASWDARAAIHHIETLKRDLETVKIALAQRDALLAAAILLQAKQHGTLLTLGSGEALPPLAAESFEIAPDTEVGVSILVSNTFMRRAGEFYLDIDSDPAVRAMQVNAIGYCARG